MIKQYHSFKPIKIITYNKTVKKDYNIEREQHIKHIKSRRNTNNEMTNEILKNNNESNGKILYHTNCLELDKT